MVKSMVSITKTTRNPDSKEVEKAVRRGISLIGGIEDIVSSGDLVLISPSWVAPPADPESAVITCPEVTKAVADMVIEMGAKPVIAESSCVGVDTQEVIETSGYNDLRNQGYRVVDLKKTPKARIPIDNGYVLKEVETFELVTQADVIISVPKLKTHDQTEMTCSLKKMKGLDSDKDKRRMHQVGIFKGISDINTVFKPALAVVDAILCQEGLGPIFGRPLEMDLVVAGRDPVSVDSICSQIMGYKPEEVLVTKFAAERGLGVMDNEFIEVVGEKLEKVKRRFMRSIEDDPVQIEGFSLIYGGVTCTGCRNTVMSALADMRRAKQLQYLPGVTVITGDPPVPVGTSKNSIVAVGQCVPDEKRGNRFVQGCPPNNAFVVQAIMGGRGKVKPLYADDSSGKRMNKRTG